jgi:transcriptional regulator with XRE-family HTH domain
VKLKIYAGEEVRDLRRKLGLNQSEFWAHFQVTQSGGSRYESGREIPDPVQMLLNIAFGTDAKATAIFDEFRQFGRPQKKTKASADEAK